MEALDVTRSGKTRQKELYAVVAALLAAAILAALLPQRAQSAGEPLPAATVSTSDVIVRFAPQVSTADRRATIEAAGGTVTHDLHLIGGLGARMTAPAAERLRSAMGVLDVAFAAPVESRSGRWSDEVGPKAVYRETIGLPARNARLTGEGVGVAVVDTGIAGDLPDFTLSRTNRRSRVRVSAVVNPNARSAADPLGHGTHIAGIIAGDGDNRSPSDRRRGRYVGVAPDARLVSVKIADDQGHATTLDAIYGIQFAVDHADELDIDVLNLSLASSVAESPRTDPLAAAAEAAWLHGIVVVAAAGNAGDDPDAVSYAPGNDPYVITVGATDDQGTKSVLDDLVPSWSSRGRTQTGLAKPDVMAPGANIISTLAPDSEFETLCPTCVVDDEYFRVGGTSMAAAVTSGAVALLLEAHPDWTPDQVKAALMSTASSSGALRVDRAVYANPVPDAVKQRHSLNRLIDPNASPPTINYTAASWRAASWRYADRSDGARPSWAAASWRCDCSLAPSGELEPQAAAWRMAASWRVMLPGAKR